MNTVRLIVWLENGGKFEVIYDISARKLGIAAQILLAARGG